MLERENSIVDRGMVLFSFIQPLAYLGPSGHWYKPPASGRDAQVTKDAMILPHCTTEKLHIGRGTGVLGMYVNDRINTPLKESKIETSKEGFKQKL